MPRDGIEIGPSETKVRRKRANVAMTSEETMPASVPIEIGSQFAGDRMDGAISALAPKNRTPHPSPIEPGETPVRKRRAIAASTPRRLMPVVSPIGHTSNGVVGEDGHAMGDTQCSAAISAPTEIGPSETKVRRKRAIGFTTPTARLPASAATEIGSQFSGDRMDGAMQSVAPRISSPHPSSIELGETPVRKRRARKPSTPLDIAPVVSPIGHIIADVAGGDGQNSPDTQSGTAISEIVNDLFGMQRKRVFCITQQSRADRSIESLIASIVGFRIDAPEKERIAAYAKAKSYRLAVEGGADLADIPDAVLQSVELIEKSAAARKMWDDLKKDTEKEMKLAVIRLPVYPWVKSVSGFGDISLACLVAEAGIPVGDYRTVSALWKRMEVAVINGQRQQRCRDKEKAEAHGYGGKRRAVVWNVAETLLKQQWRGDKDEDGNDPKKSGKPVAIPAHALGPYGEIYARRRAHTLPRIEATAHLSAKHADKWTPMRCLKDAKRIMSKALLRDLYRVWNGMPPRGLEMP